MKFYLLIIYNEWREENGNEEPAITIIARLTSYDLIEQM